MKITAASADCENICKKHCFDFVKTCYLLVSCVIHSKGSIFLIRALCFLGEFTHFISTYK